MKLQDMKIGIRLALNSGALLLVIAGCMVTAFWHFNQIGDVNDRIIEKDWVKAEAANTINATTRANARRTMELLITTDPAQIKEIKTRISQNKKLIDDAVVTLEKLIYLPQGRALLAELVDRRSKYVASFSKVVALVDDNEREAAIDVMRTETLVLLDAMQDPINKLTDLQRKIVVASSDEVRSRIHLAKMTMVGMGLAALVVGILLTWWINRSITQPLRQAVDVASTVAKGDLSATIEVTRHDEAGELLQALKHMTENLQTIVRQVRQGSESMAIATSEIAAGNLDLSSRTEEQASALQETAASMEQLSATVKNNDASSQHAAKLAESAASVAAKGGDLVGQVVQTMEAISTSSKRIGDIISLIDGIAFQTNILALNAAVEAARAGEQGRGFAVVASEVRSLAQRSAEAAKEIKTLITNSVGSVNQGCTLVEQTGSTMDEIVVHVRRVADLMREITTANHEQSTGISQVNEAVSQMDQVTQQNAALVEQSAAAAQSLEHQAKTLLEAVSVFQLLPSSEVSTPLALAA